MRRATPSPGSPQPLARRSVLVGAFAAAGLALTACRVTLEDSAPELPFIPTRDPIPAEEALLWLLQDCRALSRREQPQDDTAVTGLYEEQVAVLRTALYRAGIPIQTLDEALAQPLPPASPSPTPADDDAAAALRRLPELAECGGGIFPLVMSLLGQRWAVLTLGGVQVPDEAVQSDPARLWELPFLAVPFAQLTDAAQYGFEVVAAQSRDQTRELALEALWRIEALWREQNSRSGGRAPASQLGYPLPFPVRSPESAGRLATHVIDGLIDGYGGLLPGMVGTAQEETAVDLVAWLGSAAAIGAHWGVPIEAFPGTEAAAAP